MTRQKAMATAEAHYRLLRTISHRPDGVIARSAKRLHWGGRLAELCGWDKTVAVWRVRQKPAIGCRLPKHQISAEIAGELKPNNRPRTSYFSRSTSREIGRSVHDCEGWKGGLETRLSGVVTKIRSLYF
jgi:hypothetical protein